MSFKALQWAFDQPVKGHAQHVLLALANYANQQHHCWPSVRTLSQHMGLSKSTIIRSLKQLTEAKLVSIQKRRHNANAYCLAVDQSRTINTEKVIHKGGDSSVQKPNKSRSEVSHRHLCGVRETLLNASYLNTEPIKEPESHPTQVNVDKFTDSTESTTGSALLGFTPTEDHVQLAQSLDIDIDTELESFQHRHSGRGHLDYEFKRWLKQAHRYQQCQPTPTSNDAQAAWQHVLTQVQRGTREFDPMARQALQAMGHGLEKIRFATERQLPMVRQAFVQCYRDLAEKPK